MVSTGRGGSRAIHAEMALRGEMQSWRATRKGRGTGIHRRHLYAAGGRGPGRGGDGRRGEGGGGKGGRVANWSLGPAIIVMKFVGLPMSVTSYRNASLTSSLCCVLPPVSLIHLIPSMSSMPNLVSA